MVPLGLASPVCGVFTSNVVKVTCGVPLVRVRTAADGTTLGPMRIEGDAPVNTTEAAEGKISGPCLSTGVPAVKTRATGPGNMGLLLFTHHPVAGGGM